MSKALEYNIDSAQRELDRRNAEGEDVSGLHVCPKTAAIVKSNPPYNALQIAAELDETARGAFYGNALRVAKDIPGLDQDDRSMLDRWATGNQGGMDHVRLHDLAIRIRRLTA